MTERDRFELDLSAALRSYAEDAPTQARPTELAHRFATTYPHGRAAFARRDLRWSPAMAWVLLLAGLLLALAVGSLSVGAWRPYLGVLIAPSPTPTATPASPTPSPASSPSSAPIPSLPPELFGTWSGYTPVLTTLAVGACAIGATCGTVLRVEPGNPDCTYTLTYESRTVGAFVYRVGGTKVFACGWSPWPGGRLELTPGSDGILGWVLDGRTSGTLEPVAGSPAPVASESTGLAASPGASPLSATISVTDSLGTDRVGDGTCLKAADGELVIEFVGDGPSGTTGVHLRIPPGANNDPARAGSQVRHGWTLVTRPRVTLMTDTSGAFSGTDDHSGWVLSGTFTCK